MRLPTAKEPVLSLIECNSNWLRSPVSYVSLGLSFTFHEVGFKTLNICRLKMTSTKALHTCRGLEGCYYVGGGA